MERKNKPITLNWDEFKALGNPDNVDDKDLVKKEVHERFHTNSTNKVRIYLEKKRRRGKSVSVIKGLGLKIESMEKIAKELKKKCGTGGAVKGDEIIIQGDKRNEIVSFLILKGFKDVKAAG